MHSIIETGTVISLENESSQKYATISMDPPTGGEEECATCRKCFKEDKCDRLLKALIPENFHGLNTGARVEILLKKPALYTSTITTLGLPLAGLIAGGFIGYLIIPNSESQDLVTALMSIVCAVLFYLLGNFYNNKYQNDDIPEPVIKNIL